jgi:hypothetical protein
MLDQCEVDAVLAKRVDHRQDFAARNTKRMAAAEISQVVRNQSRS